ncbi:anti-sigma factor antagonist [Mycobacterium shigaense]|uniref:Anti-sigma factor antagonist n=1 Tax=Mycobacterium shigaense TaxID=722731 RepID=A0A1Z4EGF9_9MYCO|nr:anti-sigma factor antagonist [Mycobacterium shigaense]PRI16755.1 anti-anti-sigma factor [Mycobacterium shigaense]BAX92065.1 anti-sigma factor antagonist [Mycobacterium shigaense]
MSPVITESAPTGPSPPLMLSSRLIYELGDPTSTLRATTDRRGPAIVISAGGEIDACNEHTWRHLLAEAASVVATPGPLVVDVTSIDFMGCCAYTVLAEQSQRCRDRGIEVRLVAHQPIVTRIVDACGLFRALPIYPTVDSALAL